MNSDAEVPAFIAMNEQCLMVEQKADDAVMLSHSTLTALDPNFVTEQFDSIQENNDALMFDWNGDIYSSNINTSTLFSGTDFQELPSSSTCNLENSQSENDVLISVLSSTPSYNENAHASIYEAAKASNCDTQPESGSPSRESECVINAKPTNPSRVSATASRRRRRCGQLKEKLYMKTEPFSDEEMEKKRLNALKAKRNRIKQKDRFDALEAENATLRNELEERKSKISELEQIILVLQKNLKQKNLRMCQLRDQISSFIDE